MILDLCKEVWNGVQNYHPSDYIDIQSLIWVGYQQQKLGKPFSQMFSNFEEAEWAFDWFQETMGALGIEGESNPMIAFSLRKKGVKRLIRFIYGGWLILGFNGEKGRLTTVEIAIPTEKIDFPTLEYGEFTTGDGESRFSLCYVSIDEVRKNESHIRAAFTEGLALVRERFSNWEKSNFHDRQNEDIAKAVFDLTSRNEILISGVDVPNGPIDPIGIDISPGQPTLPSSKGYFSERSFELLNGIHLDPTKQYYETHKDDFRTFVETPFKDLMVKVSEKLPPAISQRMETSRYIFSKFLRNDFGLGRAWDFYWGAFYPLGSRRTADAQLALWINKDRLEIGFYIGVSGLEVRENFQRKSTRYAEFLKSMLKDLILDPQMTLDDYDPQGNGQRPLISHPITWDDWFENPAAYDFNVKVILDRSQVLSTPKEKLVDMVRKYFSLLFPLVLVSLEDDPTKAIEEYLGIGGEIDEAVLTPEYTIDDIMNDTGFEREGIEGWIKAINRKGQAIFYGPPGTGKTFVASKIARQLVSGQPGYVELVQFHPAYSYEEFMQGIRPKARPEGGLDYPTVPGRFLEFCQHASRTDGTCVLIIDEINRANLSRVFGELMYLLEYRDGVIPLAGGGQFKIPKNVRVIGTMNTADRSIALVDHALRRRFAFLQVLPNYAVLRRYHLSHNTGFNVDGLISVLENLNKNYINNSHYEVGISFFLCENLHEDIEDIWRMEIEPYLEEYFFDQPSKAKEFRWENIRNQVTEN